MQIDKCPVPALRQEPFGPFQVGKLGTVAVGDGLMERSASCEWQVRFESRRV